MNSLKKIALLEQEAADFGFKWETAQQILVQIRSEVAEVEVHLQDKNKAKLQEEIGDLLHAAFSLCVFCELSPEETLTNSIDKFEKRFMKVKQLASEKGLTSLNGFEFSELMNFWDQAKKLTD